MRRKPPLLAAMLAFALLLAGIGGWFLLDRRIVGGTRGGAALAPSTHSAAGTRAPRQAGAFVTRSGARLFLAGKRFRFSGANIFWPTLTSFGGGAQCTDNEKTCRYTSHFEVDDALDTAREMGATVIRSNAAVSIGCSLCLQYSPGGKGNEAALRRLDYFVTAAGRRQMHLIVALLDNWHYYQGGIHDYVHPHVPAINGVSPRSYEWPVFFTDPRQIAAFEQHIALVLNRVNSATGVAYKDDPTIMAWEIGNEIDDAPRSWISTITTYIKSIDHNHLVAFGQTLGHTGGLSTDSLSVPNLDIEDDHFYPPDIKRLNADMRESAAHDKALFIGEFNWTTAALKQWLAAIAANSSVSGDTFWSLVSHRPTFGTWDDGSYNGTYPGSTASRRRAIQLLRAHAYTMQGRPAPAGRLPGAPLITSIIGNQLAWRGTALAVRYSVERSTRGPRAGFLVICNGCATDYTTPWTDTSQPGGMIWYRVRAYNAAGKPGPYSNVYRVVSDLLDNWRSPFLSYHSPGLGFNHDNASFFGNDTSRAYRGTHTTREYIIWKVADMRSFQAVTYFWPHARMAPFSLYISSNGKAWAAAAPAIKTGGLDWLEYTYTLSDMHKVGFVKMVWSKSSPSWSPQISRVVLAE